MMKSFVKPTKILLAALVLAGFAASPAAAATISVVPGSQTIVPGTNASVDIVLSDLGEALGGFNVDLTFLDAVLDDLTVTVDPSGAMGASPLDFSDLNLTNGSPIHVEVFADGSLTAPQLATLQGSGFILASLTFKGLTEGLSPLTLSAVGGFLTDFNGDELLGTIVQSGSICVSDGVGADPCAQFAAVPEPASMILLGTGLAGLAARHRRKRYQA